MHPKNSKLAAAFAAIALLAVPVLASAASFVRVPITQNAQIQNGGLTPTSTNTNSQGGDDGGVSLAIDTAALQSGPEEGRSITVGFIYTYNLVDSAPVSVSLTVSAPSGVSIPISTQGFSALSVAVQRGSAPAVLVTPSGATPSFTQLTGPGGVVNIQWGISTTGSCSEANYSLTNTDPVVLPMAPSKAAQSYKLCVKIPAGETALAGTYTGSYKLQLYTQPYHTNATLGYTMTANRITAPASVTCSLGHSGGWMPIVQILNYDVYSSKPLSAVATGVPDQISCTNSSAADVHIHYAESAPVAGAAAGFSAPFDSMAYTISFSGATGAATIPSNGSITIPISTSMSVTLPAGQDVTVGNYGEDGSIPLTLTY